MTASLRLHESFCLVTRTVGLIAWSLLPSQQFHISCHSLRISSLARGRKSMADTLTEDIGSDREAFATLSALSHVGHAVSNATGWNEWLWWVYQAFGYRFPPWERVIFSWILGPFESCKSIMASGSAGPGDAGSNTYRSASVVTIPTCSDHGNTYEVSVSIKSRAWGYDSVATQVEVSQNSALGSWGDGANLTARKSEKKNNYVNPSASREGGRSHVAIYQYCVSALRPLSVVNFLSVYEDGVTGVPL